MVQEPYTQFGVALPDSIEGGTEFGPVGWPPVQYRSPTVSIKGRILYICILSEYKIRGFRKGVFGSGN
ncbi:MAG: hypothetical protein CMF59_14090 [Leptospiraceae bacterium]|nr:hypothetical protein [Leptospiraceae bacterium]|tara:strand:+ start:124 stop:327 length:204 start_codon:yes stop_codon:yes gene_type:complete